MRNLAELLEFIQNKMSMTDIYQPAVILHLLERDGISTKRELSRTLSGYDEQIQQYYEKILMRWPKITLTKHNIVIYERKNSTFTLNFTLSDAELIEEAKDLCEQKIQDWIERKRARQNLPRLEASTRYRVLKAARGKCELCGISSKIAPIDIDHIVPKNQADKHGYIAKESIIMHVDDERNLQALCYRCNRAKRDQDDTDFRHPRSKVVRDQSVIYNINSSSVQILTGKKLTDKLFEKLIDEHSRLIEENSTEDLDIRIVDMIETLIAIAKIEGKDEEALLDLLKQRRIELGRLDTGVYLDDNVA
ncbi:HNH endonuclease [Candidatus Viridilinea mediisalina]|uniref:HNH nuclease domain-containing protein n=1 Tax=Candidatus Viridilinea mediisalina TaxID=2024553 RepID=A0A2A6RFY7_9CHLR|nr:HNH endonuclease signature motif containing protein [Candidatus Viridilinea mediisalina]PDW01932.1 hypothetical protein CJ255_16575 [Candidatus Viridilinea mediisalina]